MPSPKEEIAGNSPGILVGALPLNYGRRGLGKNFEIEPHRPRACVFQIQADHIVKSSAAAAFHLPQAGYARLDFKNAAAVPHFISLVLVSDRRPGANKRHIPAENIPELRQLIQTGLAKEFADCGDSRIA